MIQIRVAVAILLAAFSAGAACSDSGTAEETAERTQGSSEREEPERSQGGCADRETEEARPGEGGPDAPTADSERSSGNGSSGRSAPAEKRPRTAQASSRGSSSSDRAESEAESALFSGFQARVQEYLAMREEFVNSLPPLPESTSPERIVEHQKSLASLLQQNRAEARQGNLFTESSQEAIRERIRSVLNGVDGEQNRALIFDEHHPDFKPKINQDYPEDAALSTMPPKILEQLPVIPDVLEYRIVGNHLILYDIDAGLILDFIPGAIQ